jgi:two-component system OmpR family response regulator
MVIRRVLLVDDDEDIRTIGAMALREVARFEVLAVDSGQAACEALEGFRPDVVLLDVMMPVLDGPQTLAAIRALPTGRDVPAVFVTAKVRGGEVQDLLAAGAVGVITKPFDPMTLGQQVQDLVDRSAT